MSNEDDTDPTIEVRSLSLLEMLELRAALDEEASTASGRTLDGVAEDAGLFEPVSPEIREAVLQILRASAKRHGRGKPAPESPGSGPNAGGDGSGNAEPPRPE